MKTKAKSAPKTTTRRSKNSKRDSSPTPPAQTRTAPRCTRCGSRTVRLEQLNQELLAVLAMHCLICGHHTFIGKPMVRLIRKPEIPRHLDAKDEAIAT